MNSAAQSILRKMKPGGLAVFSIRDYDQILEEKPSGVLPRTFNDSSGKRIYFQTWDWIENQPIYDLNLFILRQKNGLWETNCHVTQYRAWRRAEISDALVRAGFRDVQWLFPEQSGYYQPIVTGVKD